MRLISEFHDYYDGAMKYFAEDKHHTYIRKGELIGKIDAPARLCYDFSAVWRWPTELYKRVRIVGFCGKIYPLLINTYRVPGEMYKEAVEYCYTPEDAIKCENDEIARSGVKSAYSTANTDWHGIWDILTTRKEYLDVFLAHNVPCFCVDVNGVYERHFATDWVLRTNPALKDYKFQVIFDAYIAAQELEMYLGNELAQDTKVKVPVGSDVVIAESKGFDKYSFRKGPKVK